MLITKPTHKYYAFSVVDDVTYNKTANVYSKCKRYGFRGIVAFCTGTGTLDVLKEICKGTVVQYGKRRFATCVLTTAAHVCAPAVAVLTNATKVVKVCKVVYTTTGYIFEACEDIGTLCFLPVDMMLFGQAIPTGESKRFSNWEEIEDLIQNLPVIGDSDDN